MDSILFGYIGVDVKNYMPEDLYRLFIENGLETFTHSATFLGREWRYREGNYLQAECRGLLTETTNIYVLSGYIRYTTDMDTYLLILRTALLDTDLANELVNDLYYQGLIKPRTYHA